MSTGLLTNIPTILIYLTCHLSCLLLASIPRNADWRAVVGKVIDRSRSHREQDQSPHCLDSGSNGAMVIITPYLGSFWQGGPLCGMLKRMRAREAGTQLSHSCKNSLKPVFITSTYSNWWPLDLTQFPRQL